MCIVQDCEREIKTNNRCRHHQKKFLIAQKFPEKKCLVSGCDLLKVFGEYCKRHDAALRVYGDPESRKARSKYCVADDCENETVNIGLCIKHYARFRRNGDANISKNPNWGMCQPKLLYKSWDAMMRRCYSEKHPHYNRYGGSGITVCEKWKDFQGFKEDMVDRPMGKTLDRIENSKGYFKENCKWSTYREQSANRKSTKLNDADRLTIVEMRSAGKMPHEIAKIYGISTGHASQVSRFGR